MKEMLTNLQENICDALPDICDALPDGDRQYTRLQRQKAIWFVEEKIQEEWIRYIANITWKKHRLPDRMWTPALIKELANWHWLHAYEQMHQLPDLSPRELREAVQGAEPFVPPFHGLVRGEAADTMIWPDTSDDEEYPLTPTEPDRSSSWPLSRGPPEEGSWGSGGPT